MDGRYTWQLDATWQVTSVPLEVVLLPSELPKTGWVEIPACTHLQTFLYPDQPYWGERLRRINEKAWYFQYNFSTPAEDYARARLMFDGVDYFASVWLNDQYIGQHEGGFDAFAFDVTALLRPSGYDNTLIVRVTAPWDPPNPRGTYPTDHVIRGLVKGLYEHGEGVIPPNVNPIGIWRPVWLALDGGISIDRLSIMPYLDGQVDLRLNVCNAGRDIWQGALSVTASGITHDGPSSHNVHTLVLLPGVQRVDLQLHIPEPRLWWPWDHGEAHLYRLKAALTNASGSVVQSTAQTFGMRRVRLERTSDRFTYYINERPVAIRGSSYIEGLYLSAVTSDSIRRDIMLARAAKLNLLRVHVHVGRPELYDLCDELGMMMWQDFELNWIHQPSPAFEARARVLQRVMIDTLRNHPSVITWACHNEPTMVFLRRHNLEQRPDPALYADAVEQDETRPVFICSGQLEDDWRRAGDVHSYYGAIWSEKYTDIRRHLFRFNSEFGFEAPASHDTLQLYPEVWERLQHLSDKIETLWAYQAALIRYQVEHLRRLRAAGCAGYIHFWLADLVPQVGCGVLDSERQPKAGYKALQLASRPLLVSLEHDGRRPLALWVINDTTTAYPNAAVRWQVFDRAGMEIVSGIESVDVPANAVQRAADAAWSISAAACERVLLTLTDSSGAPLCSNAYHQPFQPPRRPRGYPWKFNHYLGTKVFDQPGAPSLADQGISPLVRLIPLSLRERMAERALRQRLPTRFVSLAARMMDTLLG